MTDPVILPSYPRARVLTPRYLDAGTVLKASHGGAAMPIGKLGDRWAFDVQLPIMHWEHQAREWVALLLQAKVRKLVSFEVFFPKFQVGVPGLPVIDGIVEGGSSLPLRNLTKNYDFQSLQFMSILHGDASYLHCSNGNAIAANDGTIDLPITPMLRTDLSDGDVVEVGIPKIRGYLVGDELSWTIDEAKTTGLSFTIEELD